ncbi:MAG: polyprenyl synthetase family protein [Thermoprotei archaeon]|nr:MAG: polyprenyl synthetase family protein [Thermoprotei archaeon]
MEENILVKLAKIGSLVDPYMEKYLKSNCSKEFEEIALYQVKVGGKRVRPALVILSTQAVGGKIEDALPIAAAVELIHNYSLILDDIIDRGEIRRGEPTVWKKYGLSMAILAAVHYREAIAEAINDSKHPLKLHDLLVKTIKTLVEGERLDILFEQTGRFNEPYVVENRRKVVTLDEYFKMVYAKTGALIEASCRAGGIVADATSDVINALGTYGRNIGIAFQIADDIIDIFGKEEKTGKAQGKDIIEHKMGNIVILLSLDELKSGDKEFLLSLLKKEPISGEELKKAIELIANTSARDRAYEIGEKYLTEALRMLEKLPENDARKDLEELAKFILYRMF